MNIQEQIRKIVDETVFRIKEDKLREDIRPMVAQAIAESIEEKKHDDGSNKSVRMSKLVKKLMKNPEFKKKAMQYLTDKDAYDGWTDSLGDKTYGSLDNLSDGSKRRNVTQRLKDKKIDFAPIAYELWPNMSQDAARSWFSKKVSGKKESFTDEEIATIYSLLNNSIK